MVGEYSAAVRWEPPGPAPSAFSSSPCTSSACGTPHIASGGAVLAAACHHSIMYLIKRESTSFYLPKRGLQGF